MKIRLMGSPDLVRRYAQLSEEGFGVKGKEYAARNSSDIRYYIDLDDRVAEAALERSPGQTMLAELPEARHDE